MLCYSDPDCWIGALLLAFEAHQNGPPGRAAGLPIVLGFPKSEQRITDLQVNVPPAATVALLAGRAYQRPTCPETAYERDKKGFLMVQGQVQESSLREWAARSRNMNLEAARKRQVPTINAFVRVTLEGSRALGHRQCRKFNPTDPPMHFLDAIRQALSASVASQHLEHFWAAYNLEWPDITARANVSFRRVLPLQGLLHMPLATEPSAAPQCPRQLLRVGRHQANVLRNRKKWRMLRRK